MGGGTSLVASDVVTDARIAIDVAGAKDGGGNLARLPAEWTLTFTDGRSCVIDGWQRQSRTGARRRALRTVGVIPPIDELNKKQSARENFVHTGEETSRGRRGRSAGR